MADKNKTLYKYGFITVSTSVTINCIFVGLDNMASLKFKNFPETSQIDWRKRGSQENLEKGQSYSENQQVSLAQSDHLLILLECALDKVTLSEISFCLNHGAFRVTSRLLSQPYKILLEAPFRKFGAVIQ